ncbi:FecR domain-containing protein [Gracilimonas sp.]|uniref:FecR family protein n=1 Tax=Gracilimonas sp. TaxID=1974203 RepID=UPI0028713365|nr:FecR family protein [Gracilimonas sp.]
MNTFRKFIYAGVLAFIFFGMASEELAAFQQTERHIGIVRKFKPDVTVQNLNIGKLDTLTLDNLGEKLFSGDSLFTAQGAYALVLFMDNSVAKVKPNSLLRITGDVGTTSKESNTRINLNKGEVFLEVQPQGNNDFEVATSRSLASVKGTNFGSRSNGYTWVEEGQVDLMALNSGDTQSLFSNMFGTVDEDGENVNSGTLSDEELAELYEGYEEMDQNFVEKEMILRFRDENGQIREIRINLFEQEQN